MPEEIQMDLTTASDIFWEGCEAVEQVPRVVSGALVFKGTRVPVSSVVANLGSMDTEEILDNFAVEQWHVTSLLEHVAKTLEETALSQTTSETSRS